MQNTPTKNSVKPPESSVGQPYNNQHFDYDDYDYDDYDDDVIAIPNPDGSFIQPTNTNQMQMNPIINSSSTTVVQPQQINLGLGGNYQQIFAASSSSHMQMQPSTSQLGISPYMQNVHFPLPLPMMQQPSTSNVSPYYIGQIQPQSQGMPPAGFPHLYSYDQYEFLEPPVAQKMDAPPPQKQKEQQHSNIGMGQASTQNKITQNDIYQIMDKIEQAKTDAEREVMHAELQKALLLWDTINQPIKSSSEKEKMLIEKIAGFDEDHDIITSLGLFFQIDRFPGTFIRMESLKAKNLILMAYQNPESDISTYIDQLRAADVDFIRDLEKQRNSNTKATSQKHKISDVDLEHNQNLLYPFVVVGHLLNQFNPVDMSTESALIIRQQVLHFGIIELLLKLLTRQAQQPVRRAESIPNQMNTIGRKNKFQAIPVANSTANANASYLPKGVGYSNDMDYYDGNYNYGSYYHSRSRKQPGTNQKELSFEMHKAENNIATLLNILIAYINPQSSKPQPKNNDDIIPIYEYDSDSSNSESEEAQAQSSRNLGARPPTKKFKVDRKKNRNLAMTEELIDLIYDYSIFTTLNAYLINDSVFYISKMVPLFKAIVSFILALAESPPIKFSNTAKFEQFYDARTLAEPLDILRLLLITNQEKAMLFDQLNKLGENIKNYLGKLRTWSQFDVAGDEEEELAKLLELVNGACSIIRRKFRMGEKVQIEANCDQPQPQQHEEQQICHAAANYCHVLKEFQAKTIPFYSTSKNGARLCLPYHFANSLTAIGQASVGIAKRTRRLAQEIASLNNSLTISENSSIFVRTSEERLDVMKVMIVGPSGTPYANGCFEFDVFFPEEYPNGPMKINFETTGNKRVRFNPNLYHDGKVCLSILNTWQGAPGENWNPATSTLLQVLVSIQSLILVEEPYYNEPGYASTRNMPTGQKASLEYTKNIRQECIRWAMIEQIQSPSHAFSEVIQRHFWLKREEICDQIAAWILDAADSTQQYLTTMNKHYEKLKEIFARMPCPDGLTP